MGLSDRKYMRTGFKIRPRVGLLARLRFGVWLVLQRLKKLFF